jgi:hypothetical protein
MTDRVNLAHLRGREKRLAALGYQVVLWEEELLALVEAVEAAHACRTVLEGSPGYWFTKSDDLDVALARFDFEATE